MAIAARIAVIVLTLGQGSTPILAQPVTPTGQPTDSNSNSSGGRESASPGTLATPLPPGIQSVDDTPVTPQNTDLEITIEDPNGSFQSWEEDLPDLREPERLRHYRVFVIPYPFSITYVRAERNFKLTGEELVVWQGVGDSAELNGRSRIEFYARGNVRLTQGGDLLRADEVFISLADLRGVARNAKAKLKMPGADKGLIYIHAKEIRLLGARDAIGEDARLSTQPFELPMLHLRSKRVRFRQRGVVRVIDIQDNGLFLRNSQIAPMFDLSQNLDRPGFLKYLNLSQSDRFGFSVLTDFDMGLLIHDNILGKVYEKFLPDRFTMGADVFTERGIAPHTQLRYKDDAVDGGVFFWYINDSGDNTDFGRARGFFPLKDDDRYRVRLWHYHELPLGLRIKAQLAYFSDGNILPEFFQREFDSRANQDTFIDLTRYDSTSGVRVFFRRQIVDSQETVQYQPRVQFFIYPSRLFDIPGTDISLYFQLQSDVARPGFRAAAGSGKTNFHSTRLDLRPSLLLPIDLGFVGLSQTFTTGASWYGWELQTKDITLPQRVSFELKTTMYTNVFRTFDLSSDVLDFKGLRHVISPEIVYLHRFPVIYLHGFSAAQTPQFDEIDRPVNTFDAFTFYLTNRLQGIRQGQSVDLLYSQFELSYYPRPSRDNNGRIWGPLTGTIVFRPTAWLTFTADGRLDLNSLAFQRYGVGGQIILDNRVSLGITSRVVRGTSLISGFAAGWRASPAYTLSISGDYDFEAEVVRTANLTLLRYFQEFALSIKVSRDFSRDDTSVSFAISPLGFEKAPDVFSTDFNLGPIYSGR